MSDWVQSVSTGIVSIIGTGGIMAWRNSRNDAGRLALDIAKEAKKEAGEAVQAVNELRRNIILHAPWDITAAHEIRKLGGTIGNPPPLL